MWGEPIPLHLKFSEVAPCHLSGQASHKHILSRSGTALAKLAPPPTSSVLARANMPSGREAKLSRRNFRGKEIANLFPFLETTTLPASDKIQYTAARPSGTKSKQLDAYILSKGEAHILLQGTKSIYAPVFIPAGAPDVCNSSSRPIEHRHHVLTRSI